VACIAGFDMPSVRGDRVRWYANATRTVFLSHLLDAALATRLVGVQFGMSWATACWPG